MGLSAGPSLLAMCCKRPSSRSPRLLLSPRWGLTQRPRLGASPPAAFLPHSTLSREAPTWPPFGVDMPPAFTAPPPELRDQRDDRSTHFDDRSTDSLPGIAAMFASQLPPPFVATPLIDRLGVAGCGGFCVRPKLGIG